VQLRFGTQRSSNYASMRWLFYRVQPFVLIVTFIRVLKRATSGRNDCFQLQLRLKRDNLRKTSERLIICDRRFNVIEIPANR